MRNLQRKKIQEGLAAEWLDVGIASGLEEYQREFQLGWNRKVVERRPEVARLVKALQGKK